MVTLIDLPGIKKTEIDAVSVGSVTAAMRVIRHDMAITAASDNGAVNVWLRDDGLWQCEFHRFLRLVNSRQFKFKASVAQWLKDWFPKMCKE